MIADKFFFSHDIFADEDDEEAWGEINDLIVSAIEAYPNKVNESKEIKTEKKIVIDNMGETYTIDTDAKTYTVKTANGEKTFTFDEMNDFVRRARGANRIYKPMSLLAYTDYKNGSLKNWGIKEEAVNTTKVNNGANVVCTLNLKGEPKEVSGGFDSVDINIKGVNELTDMIKTAITQRFAGIFKSDWNGDIYTQDIRVAEDLWLTFLDYDENNNTLNFVLDGDITEDPALNESKKEESVSEKEYDDIVSAIDNATSIEELQDIVLAVSDGTVEDEMQSMLDACIKDNDDLDTVKSLLSNIFEDNADIEE